MLLKENIVELAKKDVKDWIVWLKQLLNDELTDPDIYFGDMSFERKVLLIKNTLEEHGHSLTALSTAVFSLFFEFATNKTNERGIYYLLQLIAVFKNQEYAPEIELIFTRGDLADLKYNDVDLNLLLINVSFNFLAISDLSPYFKQILNKNEKPLLYQLGLKFFYKSKELKEYFAYIESLIDMTRNRNEPDTKAIGAAIIKSLNEMSFVKKANDQIFTWWVARAKSIKRSNSILFYSMYNEFRKWLNDRNKAIIDDIYLLDLKIFNDSLEEKDEGIFAKCVYAIAESRTNDIAAFQDNLIAFSNYFTEPDFQPWDVIDKNSNITGTINGLKTFTKDGWKFQKICAVTARNFTLENKLDIEDRNRIYDELCSF